MSNSKQPGLFKRLLTELGLHPSNERRSSNQQSYGQQGYGQQGYGQQVSSEPNVAGVEQARLRELEQKEREELELAMAISLSEADAMEKNRQCGIYRQFPNPTSMNAPKKVQVSAPPISECSYIHRGITSNLELPAADEDEDFDPALSRYLSQHYWEQRKAANDNSTPSNVEQLKVNLSSESFDQLEKTSDFCKDMRERIDVVEKLMRNALLRRRSVVSDPMFQSLFPQLINRHTVVLMRMNKLEADREYLESLHNDATYIQVTRLLKMQGLHD